MSRWSRMAESGTNSKAEGCIPGPLAKLDHLASVRTAAKEDFRDLGGLDRD